MPTVPGWSQRGRGILSKDYIASSQSFKTQLLVPKKLQGSFFFFLLLPIEHDSGPHPVRQNKFLFFFLSSSSLHSYFFFSLVILLLYSRRKRIKRRPTCFRSWSLKVGAHTSFSLGKLRRDIEYFIFDRYHDSYRAACSHRAINLSFLKKEKRKPPLRAI